MVDVDLDEGLASSPGATLHGESSPSSSSDAAALTALVEGGGNLSPAIKAVLDRDLAPSYEGVIRAHIRHQDALIARLCSTHYEEFIGSIDSLATLKADIRQLDQHVRDVNADVQASGSNLIEAAQRQLDWRRASAAMARTRALLRVCSRAADAVARAQSASNQGQLMNALKAVAGAERALQAALPPSSALFTALAGRLIPAAVDDIKGRVRADADAWIQAAQAKAVQIGACAVLNTDRRVRAETDKDSKRHRQRMQQLYFQEDEADRVASTLSSAVTDAIDLDEGGAVADDDLFERIAFVFEPLYQGLHIYESLNIGAEFAGYYTEQRSAQITKVLEFMSGSDPAHLLEMIAPYFARIAGFFIIEDAVLKSGNALMPRATMSSLWDVAVSSIKLALNDDLIAQMTSSQILDLKHQVVLYSRTMSQFGLSGTPLVSYMASHRDKYEEVLVGAFRRDLDAIFDKEKYEPMTVTDAVQYRKQVLAFGLEPPDLVDKPKAFPISVPFSGTVPRIAKLLKHLIGDYFAFAASLSDMFGPIRRCVDDLLLDLVNAHLNAILDGDQGALNVSQAVQIAVNADAFVTLCLYWERLIMVYLDPKYYVQPCVLTAKVAFSDTRTRGEDSIFEVIERKINEMLDLLAGSIVWCPQIVQSGPCDTVQMLVSFLETTMTCTQYMPASVRTTVHFASCRSITRTLVQYVRDADAVNVLAMYNLEQDVRHLEGYAAKTAIPNLHEAFAQIRQLIGVVLIAQPDQLLDDAVRQTRFPLIAPHQMAGVLDKFKETPFLSLIPPDLPRHSKKAIETIAKKLRNLPH